MPTSPTRRFSRRCRSLSPRRRTTASPGCTGFPGAKGNVGLISAVSNHFCAGCNRIRLTADGKLKPCLHSDRECSIKGLSEEEMRREIEKVILAKPACHAPLSALERSHAGRNMNQIGG